MHLFLIGGKQQNYDWNVKQNLNDKKGKYSVGGRGLTDGVEEKVNDRALEEEDK